VSGAAPAARFAFGGSIAVAAIILSLHAIKPEFEPSWRFISEYAIGSYGWIMQLAFLLWAASCAALALAMRDAVPRAAVRAGRIVLLAASGSLILAGLFPQDPVTARPEELTTAGTIHGVASMVGIPAIPLAAMLVSGGLARRDPAWMPYRGMFLGAAHATWISLAMMVAYLVWAVPSAGGFGPDVWAGWMNRLVVAAYLAWQLVVAKALIAIRRNARVPARPLYR
jgi:hypothetical protein